MTPLPNDPENAVTTSDVIKKEDDVDKASGSDDDVTLRQPGRTIVVEPLIVMLAGGYYPLMLVSQLYNYAWFTDQLAREKGFDPSNISSDHSCSVNKSSPDYIFTQEVQQATSYFGIWTNLASAVPAILATLFLSNYSDRAGRKFALVPPVLGGLLYGCVLLLIVVFKLSPWFSLIGMVCEGFGGSFKLLFVGIYAYIADTTTPEKRRFRITLVDILMMASAMTGPVAFGYWIKKSGFIWPSLFTVASKVICLIYVVFFIPETVVAKRRPRLFSLRTVRTGMQVFTKTGDRRWQLLCLFLAFFFTVLAYQGMNVDTLFELNSPLCWDSVMMGYYSTAYLAVCAIGGTVIAWLFKYCASDLATAIIASSMSTAHYVYKGFVTKTYQMFLSKHCVLLYVWL